ncbi:nitroreductase/quinone reductase family protein [Saccharomonospora glauca]|jgi:deazaflavin-dependent oxidoreductase (nitroreductase family)|uniref:Deazaflavin-dependent nitroreductase family protein n=1 Tax=Saccharomonospora glauca K62 TaxID=928724 RepID=I1D3P0_9PSEU|nr:nitroreductase/quinone reductase family protein [Saccharomonospora glauca]EIE99564.1 protein of unknown function (DUF385) [Saccharomonospora glauca K62]
MTTKTFRSRLARALGAGKRAMYRGGRPNVVMRLWNRLDARLYSAGLVIASRAVVLQVPGRISGREITIPLAVADLDDEEYVVSMLGPKANWVRNVEAADGRVVLRRRGRSTAVQLEEVPPAERAPILRRYVAVAPAARPHLGLGPTAPLAEFERIAAEHPVFRIRKRLSP